jgi:hypothetical protein
MEISDIQLVDKNDIKGKVEITLCDEQTYDDVITVKLSHDMIWKIVKFAMEQTSYSAELKKLNK